MNKYERYLRLCEDFEYRLLAFDLNNDNIYNNYIYQRNLKDNKWIYKQLRDSLKKYSDESKKLQDERIYELLECLEQRKNYLENEQKQRKENISLLLDEINNRKENLNNNDKETFIDTNIYYLSSSEAIKAGRLTEWQNALRTSLLYCYKNLESQNSHENIYDLAMESEGFNDENIFPAFFIMFCNEYKNMPYEKIVKELKKKIKQRVR